MKDFLYIGASPPEENCVQIGNTNYEVEARAECNRYIDLIRKKFGPEPIGAKLKIKKEYHDAGPYLEVIVEYHDELADSVNYAYAVEANGPVNWSDDKLVDWKNLEVEQ